MELTEIQIKFLNEVCEGKWTLNSEGEVDVNGSVFIMLGILENFNVSSIKEFGIQFGTVEGDFVVRDNNLTSLDGSPGIILKKYTGTEMEKFQLESTLSISGNNLTDYFKNIKYEDFSLWGNLDWYYILKEYPFLINIYRRNFSGNLNKNYIKQSLNEFPQTKLYYKD